MSQNLYKEFKKIAEKYSKNTAVEYIKEGICYNISYQELDTCIQSLQNYLITKKIQKDDRISFILPNCPEWLMLFFATVSISAIVVPINCDSTDIEIEIEGILKDADCKLIFTDEKTKKEKLSNIKNTIPIASPEFQKAISSTNRSTAAPQHSNTSNIACLLYSSGTTGNPKGVMLSHQNLLANANSIHKLKLISQKDRVLAFLPLYHAYPLTITMLTPLLIGSEMIFPESMKPDDLFGAMKKTNPTFFVSVPQLYNKVYQSVDDKLRKTFFPIRILLFFLINIFYVLRRATKINLAKYFFRSIHKRFGKSLRFLCSGGASLKTNVHKLLYKLGFKIIEGYGLTETAPLLTMTPKTKFKPGSAGIPIENVSLKINNPNNEGVGEVIVQGPNIMEGYYKKENMTKEVIIDNWFHTGDLGYIDKEGYLYLTGRAKEVIVLSSGKNIYPDEVEAEYLKCEAIKEICVFEVPAKSGSAENIILWATIVLNFEFFKKIGEVNLEQVIKTQFDHLSRGLPAYKRVMGFTITLDELPKTTLGKLKRYKIKNIYTSKIQNQKESVKEKKELSQEDQKIIELETTKKVFAYLKQQTKITNTINLYDLFELDLGIDSLGRIELASGLEQTFNTKFPVDTIAHSFTVKDLITNIEANLINAADQKQIKPKQPLEADDYWKKTLETLPQKDTLSKIEIKSKLSSRIFINTSQNLLFTYFKLFHLFKIEGKENIPKKGPYIIFANHTSFLDGPLIGTAIPYFAKKDLFYVGYKPYFQGPIISRFIKKGNIIPLDFGEHLLEALRSCYYVLNQGKNLCIFPEGIRSIDGEIKEFKKGFGILARESKAKLIPVYIDGTFKAWPRTAKLPKPALITIKFGKALEYQDLEKEGKKLGTKDSYTAICQGAKKTIIDLK